MIKFVYPTHMLVKEFGAFRVGVCVGEVRCRRNDGTVDAVTEAGMPMSSVPKDCLAMLSESEARTEWMLLLTGAVDEAATLGHHDSSSGERFVECYVCGKWDEHTDECFVPLMHKWMEKNK